MKKIISYLLLLFVYLSISFNFVFAEDTGWVVESFDVDANIGTDRHVDLTETIKVDFNNLQKHGIYRYVPYKYDRNGNSYSVRISIDSVKDEKGNNIKYETSRSGGNFEIKIGDADKYITGRNTYIIEYDLDRVINTFDTHDEFYWNVTGNDWPVDIKSSSINITWPDGAKQYDNKCFTGYYGSSGSDCLFEGQSGKENVVGFNSTVEFYSGEGFTVVSGIERGIIGQYSTWDQIRWFLSDNWGYFLPILTLILLIRLYLKNGKDPKGKKTVVVPEFAPPGNLRPAVMGTVIDEKVDTRDISAVIIDLAVRGYLKIKKLEEKKIFGIKSTDYELVKTDKGSDNLADYEKEVYEGIFGNSNTKKISQLQNKFYKHMNSIQDKLYETVVQKKYFEKNPKRQKGMYMGIGGVIIFIGFFAPGIFAALGAGYTSFMVGFIFSGLLFIIFSFFMGKRTLEGVEITRQIKGFRMYMDTAEKYRQQFNEKEHIFEKYLPYAMVFGLTEKWAKAFEGMQISKPTWYDGPGRFYPVYFANDLNRMQNTVNSAMVSRPSSAGSGGSGFSGGGVGGGFGGGGGGSW